MRRTPPYHIAPYHAIASVSTWLSHRCCRCHCCHCFHTHVRMGVVAVANDTGMSQSSSHMSMLPTTINTHTHLLWSCLTVLPLVGFYRHCYHGRNQERGSNGGHCGSDEAQTHTHCGGDGVNDTYTHLNTWYNGTVMLTTTDTHITMIEVTLSLCVCPRRQCHC